MHVLIGDRKVNLTQGSNGRLQATFTATDDTQSIRIPSDCIGTLNVNDIQLEQGSQATPFVKPAVQSEDMSGIFKNLHDLQIDIKDTEKDLNHQIKINQEGLEQLITDSEKRLSSRITLTADTWQGELSDAKQGLKNQITATAGLWQTKLSDTERELRSAIQLKADSLITLIEDTDSNNFTKTEQLVNGLQTTVQGDLRTQRTQLEDLISSSIESATGSRSTIWQTLNSHGSQISNAQGDISKVEQTISGYSRRISDVEGNYSSIEQTVSGLNTEVNGYYGGVQSRFRQLEGLIDARVTRGDVEGIIQNSGDNIWLAIGSRVQSVADNATMSGYEIMSEINLQADRQIFRVGDNRLMITEDTTYLDNSVIKSAHIADLAVTGAKIADASISSAKIISLDADQITGNTTNFIRSNWNNISTQISIDDRGINVTGSDRWRRTYFNQTGFELFNGSGAYNKAGVIGYFKPNTDVADAYENVMQRGGSRHSIGIGVGESHDLTFGWTNTRANSQVHTPAMIFNSEYKRIELNSSLNAPASTHGIRLNSEQHRGDYGVQLRWNNNFRSRLVLSDNTYLEARNQIHFYNYSGSRAFSMGQNNDSWRDLNMHGNSITNQSDERLKRNIMPSLKDSLGKFSKLEFKWFEYLENIGLADGLHHGVMAQDVLKFAPEWVVEDEQGYYSLNQSAMLMDAFKAIMQLSKKVKKLEAK